MEPCPQTHLARPECQCVDCHTQLMEQNPFLDASSAILTASDEVYEACPVCEGTGTEGDLAFRGPCVWCNGRGYVEHECG